MPAKIFKRIAGFHRYLPSTINRYRDALIENLLPRNRDGVPEDQAGDLGQEALPFGDSWITKLWVGNPSDNNTIEENSGNLEFKVGGTTRFKLTPNMRTVSSAPGEGGVANDQLDTDIVHDTSTPQYIGETVDLVCSGYRHVLVSITAHDDEGAFAAGYGGVIGSGSSKGLTSTLIVRRGTTVIAQFDVDVIIQDNVAASLSVPGSCILFFDDPPAGTHTYSVGLATASTDTETALANCELTVLEY